MSSAGDADDPDPAVADTAAGQDTSRSAAETQTRSRTRQIRTGDTLGRYEIGTELGEGGMATVFEARDTQLRRSVAIKVLFPHLAKRDEVVQRFQREARAAAGLDHPNILRIHDVGGAEGDDPPFIVMEIVRGRSLLQEVEQRGPMLAEVVACVGAILADALAAAHAASIVHRDVKPANVMIASGGRVLLTDFGVARLDSEDASLVTKTGALLGTPAYMSPEQASGDTATAKSDLYSLGATLYQLATGALPYTGSPARVLAQIASGAAVSAVKRRAAVGPDLSALITRLMQTEAEQRTETAAIAANELRALAAAGGLGEPGDELVKYFTDPDAFVKDKTPGIVVSALAAGEKALAAGSLPRAMALADRASSLAPDDPRAAALVDAVASGGRAHGRRPWIIAGAALALLGGGAVGVAKLMGSTEAPASDAAVVALVDAGVALDAQIATAPDAIIVEPVTDAAIEPTPDAAIVRVRLDAGVRTKPDAAVAVAPTPDAAPMLPDAAAIDPTPPPTTGTLIIKSDLWCDVTIDGVGSGRVKSAATPLILDVAPGRHEVTCSQSTTTGGSWAQTVEVVAGQTARASGSLKQVLAVRLEADATIDGVAHRKGATVRLPRGTHEVEIGGTKRFLGITAACTLKSDLQCYP